MMTMIHMQTVLIGNVPMSPSVEPERHAEMVFVMQERPEPHVHQTVKSVMTARKMMTLTMIWTVLIGTVAMLLPVTMSISVVTIPVMLEKTVQSVRQTVRSVMMSSTEIRSTLMEMAELIVQIPTVSGMVHVMTLLLPVEMADVTALKTERPVHWIVKSVPTR